MTSMIAVGFPRTTVSGVVVVALPGDSGQRLLTAGFDAAGSVPVRMTDDEGGNPLRCCLRDSHEGEELVLAAVQPPGPLGPYLETGPVFVHAELCRGPANDQLPAFWATRSQVLRRYDSNGWILGGELATGGKEIIAAAAAAFTDPRVAFVHARNVVYGCYMATLLAA